MLYSHKFRILLKELIITSSKYVFLLSENVHILTISVLSGNRTNIMLSHEQVSYNVLF